MGSNAEINFSMRVSPRDLPELMDGDCSYEDFYSCMRSLEQINRWLKSQHPVHIVDVGSGGGDLLRRIAGWAHKRGIPVQLTGIDLNPHAARAAAESTPKEFAITWVTGNALAYRPEKPVDIVVSSLTVHHLEDDEIVALLRWMEATAQVGWFINDLERSQLTSRMFGWVDRIAGWHRFVRHDGPVSFRRAFRKEDWRRLLTAAEVPSEALTVEQWRPGRLCVGRWI
jgi:SAM-dependent methyltransferase